MDVQFGPSSENSLPLLVSQASYGPGPYTSLFYCIVSIGKGVCLCADTNVFLERGQHIWLRNSWRYRSWQSIRSNCVLLWRKDVKCWHVLLHFIKFQIWINPRVSKNSAHLPYSGKHEKWRTPVYYTLDLVLVKTPSPLHKVWKS